MAELAIGRRLETREALLIAFFAAFVVATRAALRWHLHIPGHAMLPAAFALVLVRSCVDRRAAATLTGLLAGLAVAALGMGEGGPLIALKLVLPGAAIDLVALGLRPGSAFPRARGLVAGGLAGVVSFLPVALLERLAGVSAEIVGLHLLTSAASKLLFGAAGGAAGAWMAGELRHHGLLRGSTVEELTEEA